MCRLLRVSRAGFYAWRKRPVCPRRQEDARLRDLILAIHGRSRRNYGWPRIKDELLFDHGIRCSGKRVFRLMRQLGIQGTHRRRKRKSTWRSPDIAPAPDLLNRNFVAERPDQAWLADIKYVWTREGWLYLAGVTDLFTKAVVGWAMAEDLRTDIVLEALEMAVRRRRPQDPVIHHSDQGTQYTSLRFGRRLREAGIAASMGSRGDCFDNAPAESFWATLQTELLDKQIFLTRATARMEVFDFVEGFYNRQRRHSACGNHSPEEFERRWRLGIDLKAVLV